MCGISGALSLSPEKDVPALVQAIVEDQRPRGPDAQAVQTYASPEFRLALGHNRLSIIDLSEEANQPMLSEDGSLVMVFNGEIYNYIELRAELEAAGYRFSTNSDSEVLLTAFRHWNEGALSRTIGMFSLAIYDRRDHSLFLARDRFGVKPFYYYSDPRTFAFASTPRVLAKDAGLKPDLEYVARGIALKYYEDDSDIAPYDGLKALKPGHMMRVRVQDGRLSLDTRAYYDLTARADETRERLAGMSSAALDEELIALLDSANSLRLRSDVRVGLSVSGGVDSSMIASLIAQTGEPPTGFSFGHPEALDSEGPLVSRLAEHTGMHTRWVWPEAGPDLADLFWKTLQAQDAPFPHVSIMAQYAVFEAARADGFTVMLGGQGGDEAFMGYRKFYLFYLQSIMRTRNFGALPHFLSASLPLVPPVMRRSGVFWSERKRYSGGTEGMGVSLRLPAPRNVHSPALLPGQSLAERQALDVTRFSLPTLLRYEDRNSMGNSIESRLPFMDQRVVEFGIALPPKQKLNSGFGKHILRRVAKGMIPEEIRVNRDKRGFDVRQGQWLRSGLGAVLRDALEERRDVAREFLPAGDEIATVFSDGRLSSDPQAFKQAVSLIWLAKAGI
ncbi:asparagine synthase (glutamine-hydrolyzing) [Roseovarius sp. E0-M6]|uniref:asparagine synthase (glutamine-hydrolyzing) n=1 Tax=Roseovarius sp. E0-M6 TaxID=3127118 RepID=UPI00300FF46C